MPELNLNFNLDYNEENFENVSWKIIFKQIDKVELSL